MKERSRLKLYRPQWLVTVLLGVYKISTELGLLLQLTIHSMVLITYSGQECKAGRKPSEQPQGNIRK